MMNLGVPNTLKNDPESLVKKDRDLSLERDTQETGKVLESD